MPFSRLRSRIGLLMALLSALTAASSAHGQRLLDWNGPAPGVPAPALPDATRSGMRLEPVSGGWIVRVQNPLPAPAQVRLSMPAGAVYRAVPGLPAIFTLAPGEDRAVARIYVLEPDQARTLGLGLDVIPGPAGAHPEDAPYRLPFANVPVRIDQGFEGPVSHHDLANRYALDFALPVGTPVLAARAGRIIQVESGFHEGGTDPRLVALANQVRILHRDGSMALYGHLAADSVRVRSGEWVEAGAHLADSGDTGFSTGPHLHFVVQVNAGMRLAAIPFRMTGPLGELRFPTVQAVGPPEPQPLGPAAGAGARPGPL